eukprot:GDKJ01032920.1.p1 GENE.GDKJ01032920.1~~GDKJ01032920.1.p1  ORF type:complete len:184 (-),score=36.48 GDKJ01032920.1:52-603(-)
MPSDNVFEVVDAPALLPHNFSTDSALRDNIERKKDNSYYYAHSRKMELPPDAKVVKGPGLITGGFPELIATESSPKPVITRPPAVALNKYSFLDEEDKVRIYVFKDAIPEADLVLNNDIVTCEFEERSVVCDLKGEKNLYRLKFENLRDDIDVSKCQLRCTSSKLSITLVKREKKPWSSIQQK